MSLGFLDFVMQWGKTNMESHLQFQRATQSCLFTWILEILHFSFLAHRQISKFASSHHWVKEKEEKEVKVKMREKHVSTT